MEDWLNLINAETEGDLMDVEVNTNIQEVKKAIVVLRELNADEQLKYEASLREKRLHDEASALGCARREGKAEGLIEGRAERDSELIAKWRLKGYTEEQIRDLLN